MTAPLLIALDELAHEALRRGYDDLAHQVMELLASLESRFTRGEP